MSILEYLLLFLLPVIGGLLAYFLRNINTNYLKLLLSFSGAYLFAITILHIIPEVYHGETLGNAGIYILGGFLLQIILDQFSKGVEHGHMHVHAHISGSYILSVMVGLSLHSFLEGIPLGGVISHEGHSHAMEHQPLLFGIAVHKIPAAFALMSIFLFAGLKNTKAIILLVIFASITPIAALLTELFFHDSNFASAPAMNSIVAVVVGSFLHISTTILFEVSSTIHKFSIIKMIVIILGLAMALLTVL